MSSEWLKLVLLLQLAVHNTAVLCNKFMILSRQFVLGRYTGIETGIETLNIKWFIIEWFALLTSSLYNPTNHSLFILLL